MLCSCGDLDTHEYAVKSAKEIILQQYQEQDEPRRKDNYCYDCDQTLFKQLNLVL
jgi:hypothetical protein